MWRTQNKYRPINLLQIVTISPFVFDHTIIPIIICYSKNTEEKTRFNENKTVVALHNTYTDTQYLIK